MKRYDSSINVSRGMFEPGDSELKPWKSPKAIPADPSPVVYHRLFDDFTRRQEAKKRLMSIIDLKEKEQKQSSLQISNVNTKKNHRSQSKPDISKTIQRLHTFWNNKWENIEKKKKEIQETKEKEISELKKYKNLAKTDPQAFKRLTSPRQIKKPKPPPEVPSRKFSMREAIESGKRLMNSKGKRSLSHIKIFNSNSFQAEDLISQISKVTSPCKSTRHAMGSKNIDEIFNQCKSKALHMNYREQKLHNNFAISATENIFLGVNMSNSNTVTPR
ncbi:hypothetical protein SteCoe_14772 [Stentor coeruleus]|uniref:Uncharacterized protein n=1 Tax=Stentor coeruleus TaxID=5963 RepID=A0A1R2C545_9CILI|nr:hypothetical protein SteCoe_14772 [Stentor coeruleus]